MSELILLLVPDKPRVSNEVFLKIADIFINLANLSIGSIILPFIFDKQDIRFVVLGCAVAVLFWTLGLWLTDKYSE